MVAAKAEVEEGFEPGGRGETGWQNQRRMDHPLLSAWSQPPSQADKLLHPHHRYSGTKSSPIPDARVSPCPLLSTERFASLMLQSMVPRVMAYNPIETSNNRHLILPELFALSETVSCCCC